MQKVGIKADALKVAEADLAAAFMHLGIAPTTELMCWELQKNGFCDVLGLNFHMPVTRKVLIVRLQTLEVEGSLRGLGTILGELEKNMYQMAGVFQHRRS